VKLNLQFNKVLKNKSKMVAKPRDYIANAEVIETFAKLPTGTGFSTIVTSAEYTINSN